MGKHIKKVAELVRKAMRNGKAKDGSYYAEFNKGLKLYHYGSLILNTTNGLQFGGYSNSDRDAIETALQVLGRPTTISRSQTVSRQHSKKKGNWSKSGSWYYR